MAAETHSAWPVLDGGRASPAGPPVIGLLLPPGVEHAEAFGDLAGARLHPAEESAVAGAGPERRAEFATARHLARRALSRLGVTPAPLPAGPYRAPRWPPGVVGSITHCAGYRGAVVARRTGFAALGVDAEPNEPLPVTVLRRIATERELALVADLLVRRPDVRWDRLLFSVKESLYKTCAPMAGQWPGCDRTDIGLDATKPAFTARLLSGPDPGSPPCGTFDGRWLVRRGLVLTAVTRPARPGPC
ncbi:4'-phosphopantetheinyl transferase family protein [Streptomyces olivaceus]